MNDPFRQRANVLLVVFILAIGMLIVRAFSIQILDESYASQARAAVVNKHTLYPARGLLYDRQGRVLVNNQPTYDLLVVYNQIDPSMDTAKFCRLLGITKEDFEKRLDKDFRHDRRYRKYRPFLFMTKIPAETFLRFQESLYEFPGFYPQIRTIRSYPYPYAAHVLGYIREVNEKEIAARPGVYALGDYIGASGLEYQYEELLRGRKGARFVLRDNLGNDIGSFQDGRLDTLPVSGANLLTTLDIELQAYAEQLMANKTGAIVALEPATGEVLALVSAPSYNPNLMSLTSRRAAAYQGLLQDSLKPLFNRAVMAEYPPGSTFKPVLALVGLQEEVLQPNTFIPCPGYYAYNNYTWGCRQHPAPLNVGRAIQYSCNTYFFQTFRNIVDKVSFYQPQIGLDTLVQFLRAFGLGEPLGIDFPGEKDGYLPTSEFYNRLYPKSKGGWKSPTILSLGIGQGELQLTTLQMANVAAIIANRGYFITPHLLKEVLNQEYTLPERFRQKRYVGIAPEHFATVIQGMQWVVDIGTGWTAQVPGIPIAGKTGTVQNPHGKDHSTFLAFAPADNPRIALAVYVENAGGGGRFAAPIAGLLIEKYLRGAIPPARQWREQMILQADLNNLP